ncbi:MAG TPA: DUF3613 domain-containing protein [Comamonas sp.]
MRKSLRFALAMVPTLWLTGVGVSSAHDQQVQEVPSAQPTAGESTAAAESSQQPQRIAVGQATDKLFAAQRAMSASKPRPIDGEQAARSYERYLKSFEHPIPEKFDADDLSAKKD